MANILRTAKSANDWTSTDLDAYNIKIRYENAATFFGVDSLPPPTLADEVLTRLTAEEMQDAANYRLLTYMDYAMDPIEAADSGAAADFAVHMLGMLGYLSSTRMARSHKDIPLLICREEHYATANACILDLDSSGDIILVVQAGKPFKEEPPEPQLIAEATGVFQFCNSRRVRMLGEAPLPAKVVAGITLVGSSRTFFKIPVDTELARSVQNGTYPETRTIVHAHIPDIPRPAQWLTEGTIPLDNRSIILSCYEAFKAFVKWCDYNLSKRYRQLTFHQEPKSSGAPASIYALYRRLKTTEYSSQLRNQHQLQSVPVA